MKNKKKKSHKHARRPSPKELNTLNMLWVKYGTMMLIDFLLFLERDAAMEHGAMCHHGEVK